MKGVDDILPESLKAPRQRPGPTELDEWIYSAIVLQKWAREFRPLSIFTWLMNKYTGQKDLPYVSVDRGDEPGECLLVLYVSIEDLGAYRQQLNKNLPYELGDKKEKICIAPVHRKKFVDQSI